MILSDLAAESHDYQAGENLLSWAVADHHPRMMVSRERHLIWANPAAEALLAGGEHLHNSNGVIRAAPQDEQDFSIFCGDSTGYQAWTFGTVPGPVFVLERIDLSRDVVALTVRQRRSDSHIWAPFYRVFGLTRSEHQVMLALLDGVSVSDYAAQAGLSVLTVRTHVRRAYQKIGVGNREQLFRALVAFYIG